MPMINRHSMLVIPKKPLYDWQNKIFPEHPIEEEIDPFQHDNGMLYLIQDFDSPEEFEEWIQLVYPSIFEDQLFGWCTDESLWPKKRTYEMFCKWFYVVYNSMIEDVVADEIVREEDEDED